MTVVACPGVEELKQFRLGRMSEAEARGVEQHLHHCSACLARLPAIPLDDPLVRGLRGVRARPRLQNPVLAKVQSELRAQPFHPPNAVLPTVRDSQSSEDATIGAPSGAFEFGGESYSFLSPPSVAGDLGSLGAYRVLRVLGEGGMGMVLLAED